MTGSVTTATETMTLREVAALMREGDMGALPVVDTAGKLVGIITDRDIVVRAAADGRELTATSVAEIMTREVHAARPDDYVFQAIRLMGDKQVRRVPVVEQDGTLAGILSMADIALEVEDEREIAEALEDISSGKAFWKKG
jgi:CBS domain-containing protein